jgi:putative ABC transport system ATP-binding protein
MTISGVTTPLIETVNANLHLMSGKEPLHILKDITLSVSPAEVVAIVGPSGSGKTSLLMVLAGLEKASSGLIRVDGRDLTGLNEDELAKFRRHSLGILFQNFHLVPSLTALENVALALEIAEARLPFSEVREAAKTALEEVGLGDRVTHLPSALSGGEQQRVALARAMVAKPRLLLADEPTGNLDQDAGARVIELMFDLARKHQTAVVLITHDTVLANRADRRLTMNRGQLEELAGASSA